MREGLEFEYVNGLRIPRVPEGSPVITLEDVKAIQEAIDNEDAERALCTGS